MTNNTSASRLLNILKQAKSISHTTQSKSAWNQILKIQNNDSLLFKKLGHIMMLPEQIKDDINSIEDIKNKSLYLNWKKSVNTAFLNQNLSGQWSSFVQHIDAHTLDYLELTANTLNDKKPEAELSTEELDKIKKDFLEIEDEIKKSSMESKLKKFILKKILDIILAIDDYSIQGISPLEDAINSTIGQIIINDNLKKESKEDSIAEKFWQCLGRAAIIVTLASTPQPLKEISTQIQKVLPLNNNIEIENFIDAEIINDNETQTV
jgi:hypothetical protein